ncbi:hypothetical protein TWF730_007345 [Orbilia blumenaviensis]|uniref:Uncharacterized protein n=1 Tax=Orbilia blumenaviensis TaxID=1796055 RepID=A0AAV9V7F6_9PEZI
MQSLVSLSMLGERKNANSKNRTRRLGLVERNEPPQEKHPPQPPPKSLDHDGLGIATKSSETYTGGWPVHDENWPLKGSSPAERETPPLSTSAAKLPQSHPMEQTSFYIDGPADERDEIIEALVSELDHEQYLKRKIRWEFNEKYLEELDAIAPTVLQESFHDKITTISEKFFPESISWEFFGTRFALKIKNHNEMKYFSDSITIKLPCTLQTWDAVRQHPAMTAALFIEGIISNTVAHHMCDCPTFQAEGDLAKALGTFYRNCQDINPGGYEGAEWMALTLQMMHKMLYPGVADGKTRSLPVFPEVKIIENSIWTQTMVWALTDTLRLIREAVDMPFETEEWKSLQEMIRDLVIEAFNLSVQWHSKPLSFKQDGISFFSKMTLQGCSDFLNVKLNNEESILNWPPKVAGGSQGQHVIAVISPILYRKQWKRAGKVRWQVKVWTKPKLLVAPGPPPLEVELNTVIRKPMDREEGTSWYSPGGDRPVH